MDAYLQRFKRFATTAEWEKAEWATKLSALLSGRALDVYSRLSEEAALDYGKMKIALMSYYGMAQMDGQLEEVIGNKLELAGPLIDSYLKEICKCIASKLNRSKATGLVNPVVLFLPWAVFRHVFTLIRGYWGDVTLTHSRLFITITERRSLVKLFSPSRFSGENFIAHRHFKKVPSKSGNKLLSVFNGRSLVVVTRNTPFKLTTT